MISSVWAENSNIGNSSSSRGSSNKQSSETGNQANNCQRFENGLSKIEQKMNELGSQVRTRQEEKSQNRLQKTEEIQANLAQKRERIDANFSAHIEKMLEVAKTSEEKTAIAEFQETIKLAMKNRREAIDAARLTLRSQMENQITERKKNADSLVSRYRNSVKTAFGKAVSDCASGEDVSAIKSALQGNLQQAKKILQEENQERVRSSFEAQTKIRNEAIEKANQEFKATLQSAKEELKKVFSAV